MRRHQHRPVRRARGDAVGRPSIGVAGAGFASCHTPNDTLLFTAAIALAVMSAQYPLAQPWLTAKVAALCVYVTLGSIALRRSGSARFRHIAFAAALASVGYIVGVAVTRSVTLGLL